MASPAKRRRVRKKEKKPEAGPVPSGPFKKLRAEPWLPEDAKESSPSSGPLSRGEAS